MRIKPLTGAFGAEITEIDLRSGLSGKQIRAIETAFSEHVVLVFRDQDFDIDSFEVFAQSLGHFGDTPFITPVEGHPNVVRVLRERDEEGPLFGSGWHSDWSFQTKPPSATLLYAVEVPDEGGDTAYTNQYLAFETLSDSMQKLLDGLSAVHTAERSYGPGGTFGRPDPDSSMNIRGDESAVVRQAHPLVRTHPVTGRKALYVNEVYTVAIENMTSAESSALLKFLFEHSRQIGLTCRVRWRPGTLTMWDNRVTQHFAINDYSGSRREMYRITLAGEKPN
ncbi:MAG: TauD/TfdA family dioxygenase [Actinomycetota bacterium]|nr:TauD/TfdA family dioxygenase [Actinomycetota bacterium]